MEKELSAALLDPNFEKLELAIREPNIFRALAIERQEIRHSDFLMYLLDPRENHGLKDLVLRKFLREIFADEKANGRSLFDAELLDLRQVEIRREWKNIDILIILPEDIVTIENKVDSTEHSNQLQRYKAIIDREFPEKRRHYVYLTPFGTEPGNDDDRKVYICCSYSQIAVTLENILELYNDSISEKVMHYLADYLTTIKRELLMSDQLNEMAAKLYLAHKAAFDFILENRPDPAAILYPYFKSELETRGYVIGSRNKGYIRFTTRELVGHLPRVGNWWPDKEIFLFEIDYFWSDRNAIAKAVISPGDEQMREKILSAAKGLKFFHAPEGKKWLVFYVKKLRFVASETIKEDELEIKRRVASIVDSIAGDANEIFATIERSV